MTPERFDAIVVGAGPAGETVASLAVGQGFRTALVEQELVGGECAYWACIPSKTLLRPAEVRHEAELAPGTSAPEQRFSEVAKYRDHMIRNLDDREQIESYEKQGIRVFKGPATFTSPREVEVGGTVLQSERIVIATGSEPLIPPIDGLAEAGYWTNRDATTLSEVPESVIVLGGGPAVGIELAQLLRRFGSEVQLLEASERLLAREDPRVSALLLDSLREDGVGVHLRAKASSVSSGADGRTVSFGDQHATARELIVAVGRRPRIDPLALQNAGIEPGRHGIEVDERCRAAQGIWGIGDVTGTMAFTHVAMYQGRIASADLAGQAQVPLAVLKDTVAQFPTYTEAYLKALEALDS